MGKLLTECIIVVTYNIVHLYYVYIIILGIHCNINVLCITFKVEKFYKRFWGTLLSLNYNSIVFCRVFLRDFYVTQVSDFFFQNIDCTWLYLQSMCTLRCMNVDMLTDKDWDIFVYFFGEKTRESFKQIRSLRSEYLSLRDSGITFDR